MKTAITLFICLISFINGFCQSAEQSITSGNNYYRLGQFEMAEREYRRALKIDSTNEAAQHNFAKALYRQKKNKEAIDAFNNVAATTQDKMVKSAAYYNAGVVFSKQKDLEASIEAYKNALRNNPNDKDARENLQKALLEQKQKQKDSSQEQKKPQSNMSQKEAERKLDQLQEKEKKIQQRIQQQKGGTPQQNDW